MPDARQSFQDVLNAAIADIADHGFDSMERIDRWTAALKAAAEQSFPDPRSVEQQVRDGLTTIYRRLVERGGIYRHNPGVQRYTIERLRPALRNELDRRILASANLIKLNRSASIEKTLQRFQGWSTSIPKGGVPAKQKAGVKDDVRKSMRSLPFEERRVLIDQGHKLIASINDVVASDGGAIALIWRSNWRQPGYDYREPHKERDGRVYLIRDSWAHKAGLVKKGTNPYYDEITAVAQEPFCRCYAVYIFSLSELPVDMLTAKGKAMLAGAREQINRFNVRADAAEADPWREAKTADRLGFLAGARVVATGTDGKWHASYDPDTDRIETHSKFETLPADERLHVMLHEAGHRGQEIEPALYETFKAAHLNDLPSFLEMANPVHLRDFEEKGHVDGGIATEVFAESYARAVLGLPMPEPLREFWMVRLAASRSDAAGKMTKAAARYVLPAKDGRQCNVCTMFCGPSSCTAVAGDISPAGVCRLWEADARMVLSRLAGRPAA